MRFTLPTAIITIMLYEIFLISVSYQRIMARLRADSATRQGDWLDTIQIPLWWWALVVVPPVLLIGYWEYRRAR